MKKNKFAVLAFVIIAIELFISILFSFDDSDSFRSAADAVMPFLWTLALPALICGVIALRQIARTNENGKILAWFAVVIAGFQLFSVASLLLSR